MNLSFIIPAYNASSTLVRALDSIYNLPLNEDDYEVIVVDDCSLDDTHAIALDYAKIHSNMLVLHQKQNHRQGAARNIGLLKSRGDYVMFVDADDVVEIGLCDVVSYVKQKCVDILVCDYHWLKDDVVMLRKLPKNFEGKIYNGREFLESVYDVIVNSCPINYLWARNFLLKANHPFIEDRRMEDIDWIENNIFEASAICYLSIPVYTIIGHPESTTHTTNIGTISDWLHFCYRRYEFAEQYKVELPMFYKKVMLDTPRFVIRNTRLWMLSNFSPMEINNIYLNIGKETLHTLKKYAWPWQANLFIKYPKLELIIIFILYPISKIGRKIVRKLRSN